jgi:hypothetical protein
MNAKVAMGDDGTAMRTFIATVNAPALVKAA